MFKLRCLVFLLFIISCGHETEPTVSEPVTLPKESRPSLDNTASEFKPYVLVFKKRMEMIHGSSPELNQRFSDIEVAFSDTLADNVIGTCHFSSQTITINRDLWFILSPPSHEEVIFHELGHCILDRRHNDEIIGEIPVSIMNSYHMGPSFYLRSPQAYRNYMAELFSSPTKAFSLISYNQDRTYPMASLMALTEFNALPLFIWCQIDR